MGFLRSKKNADVTCEWTFSKTKSNTLMYMSSNLVPEKGPNLFICHFVLSLSFEINLMVVGTIPEHVCTSERMNERMPGGVHLLIRALISELKAKVNANEKQCVNELLVYTWVVYFCLLNGLWDQCCHHFFIKVNHQCILYASGSVCV